MQGDEGLEGNTKVLLPGIFNEITLHQIVPKLLWRDFYVLSIVSPAWHHAIRSGQVHEVRARLHSAETVVPVIYTPRAIALYSARGNSWYQLPPIPNVSGRQFQFLPWKAIQKVLRQRFKFPWGGCISMDGKIYVLGGITDDDVNLRSSSIHCQLYVFDLARVGRWEQLANVTEPRQRFACGVKDGKIYVFGGALGIDKDTGLPIPVNGSEVYDPKENRWSPINPMICPRYDHCVETVGEEFLVHNGFGSRWYLGLNYQHGRVTIAEAYHPGEDKWRAVESFWSGKGVHMFTAQERLFSTRGWEYQGRQHIHVYDVHQNSWTVSHSFSLDVVFRPNNPVIRFIKESDGSILFLMGIQAVEDELLAVVSWNEVAGERVLCLLQSRGFGTTNTAISWQIKTRSTTRLPDFTCVTDTVAFQCCHCRF